MIFISSRMVAFNDFVDMEYRHYRRSTLLLLLLNYFPTFSGSWSDFVTWTTAKTCDWLIDWLIENVQFLADPVETGGPHAHSLDCHISDWHGGLASAPNEPLLLAHHCANLSLGTIDRRLCSAIFCVTLKSPRRGLSFIKRLKAVKSGLISDGSSLHSRPPAARDKCDSKSI